MTTHAKPSRGTLRRNARARPVTWLGMPRGLIPFVRPAFWLAAIGLAVWLVAATWMKWFDLLIDAGREMYVPWRILHGEHLGRDIIHAYGPLSSYLNAALFAVFGVSLQTLVWANLAVYAGVTWLAYRLLRHCFGFAPAAFATLFGIVVLGFGHHLFVANFTFAAPYSHEATHGLLLLLVLLTWFWALPRHRGFGYGLLGGAVTGLLWLTKTEFVFASVLVIAADILLDGRAVPSLRSQSWIMGGAIGCTGVLLATWLWLWPELGAGMAARVATNGILAPLYLTAYSKSFHVLQFLGVDEPWRNGLQVLAWGGGLLALMITLAWSLRRARSVTALIAGGLVGCALAAWAWTRHGWMHFGKTLPLIAAGALVLQLRGAIATPTRPIAGRRVAQILFWIAAGGMLARMALAPKLYHYGFFQAYLAALGAVAFLASEGPRQLGVSRPVRRSLALCSTLLAIGVAASAVSHSLWSVGMRNTPVGEGRDRVYAYDAEFYPLTDGWDQTRQLIVNSTPEDATVLVVPEGLTLNYWTRRKHPLRIMDLLPATLRLNPGDVLTELQQSPPEIVVFVTRANMPELGFPAYGADEASGRPIITWVVENYEMIAQGGGPPLEPGTFGIQVWRRRP